MSLSAILYLLGDNSLTILNFYAQLHNFVVSQAVSTNKKNKLHCNSTALSMETCEKCGGNGYMKSSPNCYHTCLTCLGKGLVIERKENIN